MPPQLYQDQRYLQIQLLKHISIDFFLSDHVLFCSVLFVIDFMIIPIFIIFDETLCLEILLPITRVKRLITTKRRLQLHTYNYNL